MAKGRTLGADRISFIAALADGRACLSLDREGEARLVLIVSQQEAAMLAQRWTELMDTAFRVTLIPE